MRAHFPHVLLEVNCVEDSVNVERVRYTFYTFISSKEMSTAFVDVVQNFFCCLNDKIQLYKPLLVFDLTHALFTLLISL